VLVLLLALTVAPAVFLGRIWKANADRGGQQPAEPFRIAGNFYYVGANDLTSFLITGPEGHVVLDGGYPGTAPMIIASIVKLGFDISDVKVLLNSDPHGDHAGGLAVLQQASGAELWASEASAGVIASGGDDPDIALPLRTLVQIGILSYPAARVDHLQALTTFSTRSPRATAPTSTPPRISSAAGSCISRQDGSLYPPSRFHRSRGARLSNAITETGSTTSIISFLYRS
jgi:Metallo-beta-lactamase superfamily